jgi:hypothetical protein
LAGVAQEPEAFREVAEAPAEFPAVLQLRRPDERLQCMLTQTERRHLKMARYIGRNRSSV